MTVSNDEQAKVKAHLERLRDDVEFRLNEMIKIKPKAGGAGIPLKLWPSQKTFLKHKSRINDVIKIRQQGFTVIKVADATAQSRMGVFFPEFKNRLFTIFTKSDQDTEIIFDHVRFMDSSMDKAYSGVKSKDAAKAIRYKDTGCRIRIVTAGKSEYSAEEKGRSATDWDVHVTEAPLIQNLGALVTGILGSVVDSLTMEGTSSGPRGFFSQHYLANIQNGNEIEKNVWRWNDRTSFFFGFLEHPEYVLPVTGSFQTESAEEERLMTLGATPEKIVWRRRKMEDYGRDTLSADIRFKRDYPATWQDAFVESGGQYFDQKKVTILKDWVKTDFPTPLEVGFRLVESGETKVCEPDNANRFLIWRPPADGWKDRYLLFADCGQGMPDSDFDVMYVGDLVNKEVVAMCRGRFGAEVGALNILRLASYYHRATIAWDVTGIGAEFRPYLLRYPNLWSRYKRDNVKLEDPNDFGLVWTKGVRSEAVSRFREVWHSKEWTIPYNELYEEQATFTYQDEDTTKPEATTGFKDDCVMSMAGLIYVADRLPFPVKEVPVTPLENANTVNMRKLISKARQGEGFTQGVAAQFGG